jgi:streptomycin 6-kinase
MDFLLKNYSEKWNLMNPVLIAETGAGRIYKVMHKGRPLVLKVLTSLGKKEEGRTGALALKYFNGQGSVELLRGDNGALLLSYVDGRSLKDLVLEGQDRQASEIICKVLEKLHAVSALDRKIPAGLITMEEKFDLLFTSAKVEGDSLVREAAFLARHLLKTQERRAVLHGDIHHSNILESSTRGWVAIDAKGLVGDPTYDFANVFYNPDDQPWLVEEEERILWLCALFSERFGVDPKRILEFAFVYGVLSACWAVEDGLDPTRRRRIAGMIQKILN